MGRRVPAGELAGVSVASADPDGAGLPIGNANVDSGDGDIVADTPGEGDDVAFGDGEGVGVGLGLGEGGIIFSHLCNGTVAPPISFSSVSQRA